jgi:hypothetical protein
MPIDLTVLTDAVAEKVTAKISLDTNESHNYIINLENINNFILWRNNSFYFDIEGNWTINITCEDTAGYLFNITEISYFVGKPDLEIVDIIFSTDNNATSPEIYVNDTVFISSNIKSYNASIHNVNVTLSIYDIENEQVVHIENISGITIYKGEINLINFSWPSKLAGYFNVSIYVDIDDLINESDETNNDRTEKIAVKNWPYLEIKSISFSSGSIIEFEDVKFEVVITNNGLWDAEDYEVRLYIEPISQGIMMYQTKRDSTIFSVEANSTATVNLYWDSAKSGEYFVGAKIITTDTKKNLENINHILQSVVNLKVKGVEKNDPVISNVIIDPYVQEQGGLVTVKAKVTDDTGLDYVKIKITNPSDITSTFDMARTINFDEFIFTTADTLDVGIYKIEIITVDLTIHENNASVSDNFEIIPDQTDPAVSYFTADPNIQLIGESVEIICFTTDSMGIHYVDLTIHYPVGTTYLFSMDHESEDRYVYENIYNQSGEYVYHIKVSDNVGRVTNTENKTFWITKDLDDIDSDGMPNSWEEKYNLNPKNPTDADEDLDGDGYTNLKEYEIGTNPEKEIFLENVAYRLEDNIIYLTGSILAFIIIMILALIGKRRNT